MDGSLPLDLVFSFDTTGSMNTVIDEVRLNIAMMLDRLCGDIPELRVALIAHGDYGDDYETEIRDFGTSLGDLVRFVKTVQPTFGLDNPECYELVLQQTRTHLSWRPNSSRVLVIVGDAFPHEVRSKRNKYKIDWKAEVQLLRQMGVTIYCVQCNTSCDETTSFMTHATESTGGLRLPLAEFRGIRDFLMAIAYREGGREELQDIYEREVRAREGAGLSGDVSAMLSLVRRKTAATPISSPKPTKAKKPVARSSVPGRTGRTAKAAAVRAAKKTGPSPATTAKSVKKLSSKIEAKKATTKAAKAAAVRAAKETKAKKSKASKAKAKANVKKATAVPRRRRK